MPIDEVTQYLIAMYLAAGGEVNKVRNWLREAGQSGLPSVEPRESEGDGQQV